MVNIAPKRSGIAAACSPSGLFHDFSRLHTAQWFVIQYVCCGKPMDQRCCQPVSNSYSCNELLLSLHQLQYGKGTKHSLHASVIDPHLR